MDALGQIIAGKPLERPVDALTREKLAEFNGRDPHASGAGQQKLCIAQPKYPQFHFEWHPQTRKVWMARLGRMDDEGRFFPLPTGSTIYPVVLAEHANTHGEAYNFVQTYLRGYQEGRMRDITSQGQAA